MWQRHNWTLAAEVRMRSAKLGATIEDRARLRLDDKAPDVSPTEGDVPGVAAINEYRSRLSG
jgi:hypothetical protein